MHSAAALTLTAAKIADAVGLLGLEVHVAIDEPGLVVLADQKADTVLVGLEHDYDGKPTREELSTLRRVAGKILYTAYELCFAGFCERRSVYSSTGVIPISSTASCQLEVMVMVHH